MSESYDESRKFVEANGIRFHYALDGDPSRPLLALVNMASANLTTWEPVLDALLENFQILRFDIRGTGKAAGVETMNLHFPNTRMILPPLWMP